MKIGKVLRFIFPTTKYSNGRENWLKIVLFDASCKASTSMSLNDTGLKLQASIAQLSLLLRMKPVAFTRTYDIRQMYPQILDAPELRPFQLIHFRFDTSDPIQLNTVTYGVASAVWITMDLSLFRLPEFEEHPW